MPVPVSQAEVVSAPSGTGTTIAITLPSHQEDDILIVQVGWKGNQAPTALTGWTLYFSQATGTATNGCGQGVWWRRVNPSETVSNPTLTIGTTAVERRAIAYCIRGADIDNPANTFWQKQQTVGNSAAPTPPGITTLAPNYLLLHLITCRGNSAITPPTGFTEEQDSAEGTTICVEGSTKTQAAAVSVSGQSASISSNRWVAAIIAIPSPDYPYFRSQTSQTATSTSVTGTLPTGTTAADFYGRKDLIIATVEAAGTAPSPNTPADWTSIATWETTTSGGATTVRQYWALYDGSINLQFNRSGSGEISLNLSTYRNPHQTAPIGNVNVRQNASSTTSTWDALTRSHTKSTVAAMCVADATPSYTAPAGWTEREDGLGMTCADQIFETAASTASASFTLSTASPTACGLVEIKSHAGVAGAATLERAADISVSASIATAAQFFTIFSRSVVVDTAGVITVSGIVIHIHERSTAVSGIADLSVSALFFTIFEAAATLGAVASIDVDGESSPPPPPFPATPILDDFNRSNGGLGANWGGQLFSGDGNLAIDTNRVKGSTLDNNSQGWATQFEADCEVYVELVSTTSGDGTHLMARVNALDTTPDCYAVSAYGGGGNIVGVYRYDNGALHVFDEITQQVSNGDWLGLRIIGSTLTVYYKDISVSSDWVQIGEFVDSTYGAGGYIGLLMETTGGRADNFGGGTLGAETFERLVAVDAAGTVTVSAQFFSVIERSLSLDATADVSGSGTFFSILERASAIDVTGSINATGLHIVERSTSLDASAEIAIGGARVVDRSASLTTATSVESSGVAFTVLESAASLAASASIESSAILFSVVESAASAGAVAAVEVAGVRIVERASSLAVTAAIESSATFFSVLSGAAQFDATVTVAASAEFFSILERQSAIDVSAAITTVRQVELARLASLSAVADIAVTGGVEGGVFEHERSAAIDATGTIELSGLSFSIVEAVSAFTASALVVVGGQTVRERSASLGAGAFVAVQGQRGLLRSVAINATAAIESSGASGTAPIERATALSATAAITVSATFQHSTPPRRTFVLESERRTITVPVENRVYVVPVEDREEVVV